MSKGIFITATDTDVGKTYISAQIVKMMRNRGINAGYYKAALSGTEERDGMLIAGDAAVVYKEGKIKGDPNHAVTTLLRYPASPHLSAKMEGKKITLPPIINDYQRQGKKYDFIVAEGSGGIICPLHLGDEKLMLTDVIKALKLEVLVVSPSGLGAINSTLLTIAYAEQLNIPIKGIVLNYFDPKEIIHQDNKKVIEKLSGKNVFICEKGKEIEEERAEALIKNLI